MRYFCTLFNSAYQYHAHLLYNSLSGFYEEFELYLFCFDEESLNYCKALNLPNAKLVSIAELETAMPELNDVKKIRSIAEYFFTCTPAICKYVMEKYSHVNEIVYLDADLFFYQSPEPIFEETNKFSISIISHRFNWLNYFRNIYGFYNVGWVSFKRDKNGLACLNNWFSNNLDWCYDKLTFTRYADQKYLNYWKKNFENVGVIKNKGANVAPWNVGDSDVNLKNSVIYINNTPLIFYHFASLKFIDRTFYTTISSYFSTLQPSVIDLIYVPYIKNLTKLGFKPKVSLRLNNNFIVNKIRKFVRVLFKDSIKLDC